MPDRRLKEKAKHLDITVRIGKSGISDAQIEEMKKQLRKRKLIKVKMLNSFTSSEDFDKKEAIEEILTKTGAELIEKVGFVMVLTKGL